jgi:hypothetical protein
MQVIAQHIPPSIMGAREVRKPYLHLGNDGNALDLSKQMRAPPAEPLVSTTRPRSQSIP